VADTSADAGVVQSRVQLERLIAVDELAGRTIAGFPAPSVLMRGVDLDGVTISKMDFCDADGDEARLERSSLVETDGRKWQWKGALWHRVTAKDCNFTEIDFTRAQLLRCELGPVRLTRARFHRATLQNTTFKESELYCADFTGAVLINVTFDGYEGQTVSLSRTDFAGASLFGVDFKRANLYSANLRGAALIRCDLSGVNLVDADLTGARLVGCKTNGADLDGAKW
jgi:uncharacterized protein YjbI with pentapeptide repeats